MKTNITTHPRFSTNRLWPAVIAAALLLVVASPAMASKGNAGNPRILPPQSHPHGQTYGEWAVAWWQWALSIPADRNPVADTTGEFCGEGQSGSVWFLAGTFGSSVERTCTVPTGKALFMPVFNWIFGAGVGDCTPPDCDVDTLRASAAAATESATVLDVSIDGVPVQNVRDYRASSPEAFSVTFPDGAVFGLPAGTFYPHVADGYWLMLAPLDVGSHTIRLHVVSPLGLDFEVLYHLTVAPEA